MPLRFFGQFLIEQGAITRDGLLDAAKHQRDVTKPICVLAVEKGVLSPESLAGLDDASRESGKLAIEIALRQKLLTFVQVEKLAALPVESRHSLAESLVRRGHLSLVALDGLLRQYHAASEAGRQQDSEIRELLVDIPYIDIIAPFLEVTVEMFLTYTNQIVEITSAEYSGEGQAEIAYVFSQRVVGEQVFDYALVLPEDFVLAIASHMHGEEMTDITAVVLDASAEFVNVVVGNGCTRLGMKNVTTMAGPPQVVMKETAGKDLFPAETVSVKLRTAKDIFSIMFSFIDKGSKAPEVVL